VLAIFRNGANVSVLSSIAVTFLPILVDPVFPEAVFFQAVIGTVFDK